MEKRQSKTHPLLALRRRLRRLPRRAYFIAGGALIIILMVVQIIVLGGALPAGTVINGQSVGNLNKQRAKALLIDQKNVASFSLQRGSERLSLSLYDVVDQKDYKKQVDQAIAAASNRSWLNALPLYFWWGSLFTSEKTTNVGINQDRRDDFAGKTFLPRCNREAINATVKIEKANAVAVPETLGYVCKKDAFDAALAKAFTNQSGDHQLTLKMTTLTPTVEKRAAQRVAADVNALLKPMTLTYQDKKWTVPRDTLASWLQFTPDPGTKSVGYTFAEPALADYLAKNAAPSVNRAATKTVVDTTDGVETSRKPGTPGLDIVPAATRNALLASFQKKSAEAAIATQTTAPPVVVNPTFTHTQRGLQAYLAYASQTNPGFRFSVTGLSGNTWSASARGSERIVAASTYKLYVAYFVLKDVQDGKRTMNDPVNGTNIDTCLTKIIVNSDNACAVALIHLMGGFGAMTNMIHGAGWSSTSFNSGDMITTPNDLANFLARLYRGELLNPNHQGYLLNLMKRQVYRAGIPAGTGVTVADKVGFLDGMKHDAGIVYGPTGDYVLVIMSDKSEWSNVAALATKIHQLITG